MENKNIEIIKEKTNHKNNLLEETENKLDDIKVLNNRLTVEPLEKNIKILRKIVNLYSEIKNLYNEAHKQSKLNEKQIQKYSNICSKIHFTDKKMIKLLKDIKIYKANKKINEANKINKTGFDNYQKKIEILNNASKLFNFVKFENLDKESQEMVNKIDKLTNNAIKKQRNISKLINNHVHNIAWSAMVNVIPQKLNTPIKGYMSKKSSKKLDNYLIKEYIEKFDVRNNIEQWKKDGTLEIIEKRIANLIKKYLYQEKKLGIFKTDKIKIKKSLHKSKIS